MATPSVDLLREWSHRPPRDKRSEAEAPVIATLVPKIYRKGNVFFQNAYQHFNCSARNEGNQKTLAEPIQAVESYELNITHSLPSWILEEDPDEGELHHVDGQLVAVPIMSDNDDDSYDEIYQNRGRSLRKTRSLGHGSSTTKLHKLLSMGQSRVAKQRKGSKDKKTKGNKSKKTKDLFPVRFADDVNKRKSRKKTLKKSHRNPPDITIPLATPCVNLQQGYYHQKNRGKKASIAPRRQNMSRAACDAMRDAKIIPDCEISELDTDIDQESTINSPKPSDTDFDTTKSTDDIIQSSSSADEEISVPNSDSWLTFIENTKTYLLDEDVSELETDQTDTDTDAASRRHASNKKSKSLPNIFMRGSTPAREGKKESSVENRVKQFEARKAQVSRLSSQLQTPSTPRKLRRRDGEETTENVISSPPRRLFEELNRSSPRPRSRKRQSRYDTRIHQVNPEDSKPKDFYNNSLKIVFVGSPGCGKSSLVHSLINKKQRYTPKSVDMKVETWRPTPLDGNLDVEFNLWDLKGGNLDTGAHHVSLFSYQSPSPSLYQISQILSYLIYRQLNLYSFHQIHFMLLFGICQLEPL